MKHHPPFDHAHGETYSVRDAMNFPFNEEKAAEATAYLLALSGGSQNYLKLIKLLYMADRETVLHHGRPITGASPVSMAKGPVLSEVLDLVRERATSEAWSSRFDKGGEPYEIKLRDAAQPPPKTLSKYECRVLGEVFQKYGQVDKWDLVEWLHDNIPEWDDPGSSSLAIDFEEMIRASSPESAKDAVENYRRKAKMAQDLQAIRTQDPPATRT